MGVARPGFAAEEAFDLAAGERPTGEELFLRLEAHAAEAPGELAVRIWTDLNGAAVELDRAGVLELARRGAAAFRARGLVAGDRVLVDLPTSEELVAAILGAFHLGAWPASVAPFSHRRGGAAEAEWSALIERLQPAAVVSGATDLPAGGVPVMAAAELLAADPASAGPRAAAADTSYVQFSSGSTGTPKALVLGMPGVVFNIEAMLQSIPLDATDRIVSWLPVYHDMGLFGCLLLALYGRIPITVMDPSLFARNPLVWLKALDEFRGTATVGPPSAVKATLEFQQRRPLEGLDLSCLKVWLCGAEQVTPAIIERFAEQLSGDGLDGKVLFPTYGMSEITLAATMPPPGRGPVVRELGGLGWASVGSPLPGQAMRVVDEAGDELPDGEIGRVLLDSPSLYTDVLDRGELTPREGWLDTGDLGFTVDGELHITGRSRELIIKGGRNYAPERLEELATMFEGVARALAFGAFDERRQTERAVVMAEVHPRELADAGKRDALRLGLRKHLGEAGYEIDEVILEARGGLPRTTSGKLRRGVAKQAYVAARAEAGARS